MGSGLPVHACYFELPANNCRGSTISNDQNAMEVILDAINAFQPYLHSHDYAFQQVIDTGTPMNWVD